MTSARSSRERSLPAGTARAGWDGSDLDAAVRTARARLVPFLVLMFTLAFLDRTNIGLAEQAFRADTGVSDAGFAFGAGLFFVGYAVLEVPSNLMLRRFGARRWLCRVMVSWGIVAAATVFARGEWSFWALRFLLGVAEAGFFPGVILYLGSWFPRRERGRVIGTFYFGLPLALVLGNPLGGALLALDGAFGLHGWQWLFLAEGALAAAVGVAAWFVLIDRPSDAPWLADGPKAALSDVMAAEERSKAAAGDVSLRRSFTDPVVALLVVLYTLIQVGSYGLAFSLPTTVGALLGVKVGPLVGLVSAGPWAVALLAMAVLPDRAVKAGARKGRRGGAARRRGGGPRRRRHGFAAPRHRGAERDGGGHHRVAADRLDLSDGAARRRRGGRRHRADLLRRQPRRLRGAEPAGLGRWSLRHAPCRLLRAGRRLGRGGRAGPVRAAARRRRGGRSRVAGSSTIGIVEASRPRSCFEGGARR